MTSLAGGGDLGDLKELASLDLHNNQLEKLQEEIDVLRLGGMSFEEQRAHYERRVEAAGGAGGAVEAK